MRTIILPSLLACIPNAAMVHSPPKIKAVPLNASAPVKSPPWSVTNAPEIGVPVKVLPSVWDPKMVRYGRYPSDHAKHGSDLSHIWTYLSTTRT
jgi:hypothetical protein